MEKFSLNDYENSRSKKKHNIVIRKCLADLSADAIRNGVKIPIAFYLRVSTKHKSQEQALKAQKKWMEEQERRHPEWQVTWYIDYGKTGTNKNRVEFKKMLEATKRKQFSYIVSREVSRFSRNTSLTLVETDELRENYNIGVYFIFDDIDTFIPSDRSKLLDRAKQSEEESLRTSLRVHATFDNQIDYDEEGKAFGPPRSSGNTFGYKSDDANKYYWLIESEQAKVVEEIYNMALKGCSLHKIKVYLEKNRIKTNAGGYTWHTSTICHILHNPVYIGLQYQNTEIILPENFLAKKKTKLKKEHWILVDVSEYVPHILTEELYYGVQSVMKTRQNYFKENTPEELKEQNKDIWSALMMCGCGCSYRKEHKDKDLGQIMYRCYNQINNGSIAVRKKEGLNIEGACGLSAVPLWKILLMEKKIENLLFSNKEAILEDLKKYYEENYVSSSADGFEDKVAGLQAEITKLTKRKANLNKMYAAGELEESDYIMALNEIKDLLNIKSKELKKVEVSNTKLNVKDSLDILEESICKMLEATSFNDNLIYELVDLVVQASDTKFMWFLNLIEPASEEEIAEENKIVFYRRNKQQAQKIVKDKSRLWATFSVSVEEARNFKQSLQSGFVKRWQDLEVEVYI